jgi:hypothetical protein
LSKIPETAFNDLLKVADYDPLANGPDNTKCRNAAKWARDRETQSFRRERAAGIVASGIQIGALAHQLHLRQCNAGITPVIILCSNLSSFFI